MLFTTVLLVWTVMALVLGSLVGRTLKRLDAPTPGTASGRERAESSAQSRPHLRVPA